MRKKINWVLGCQGRIWRTCQNPRSWILTILNRSYKVRFTDLIRYLISFGLLSDVIGIWFLALQVLVLWMFLSTACPQKQKRKGEGRRRAFKVGSALCSALLFSSTDNRSGTNRAWAQAWKWSGMRERGWKHLALPVWEVALEPESLISSGLIYTTKFSKKSCLVFPHEFINWQNITLALGETSHSTAALSPQPLCSWHSSSGIQKLLPLLIANIFETVIFYMGCVSNRSSERWWLYR